MDKTHHKLIIGIVGGIGSGKSTAASQFCKLGCKLVDADAIVHELLDEGKVREEIIAEFGDGVLDKDGRIDRGRLGEIVFAQADRVKVLTAVLHWRVLEQVERLIEAYEKDEKAHAIVLDMPLLVEVDWAKKCEKVVFIECELPKRLERVQKKCGISKKQLKMREKFQISLDKKKSLADNVVDNNSDCSAMAKQVAEIFMKVLEES